MYTQRVANEADSVGGLRLRLTATRAMAVSAPSAASLLADFVAAALAAHLRHDDRAYDTLLAQLSASVKANDSAAVSRWLAAIAGCSSTIASAGPASFRGLLSLLLDHVALPSLGADSLPTYCSFLVDFATAAHTQQGAAEAALRKLVDALHFAAEPEQRASNDRSDEASTAAGAAHSDAQQVHVAAHAALKRYIPSHFPPTKQSFTTHSQTH